MVFFFFFVKAPVFAKEVGKLVQLKQDRAFQAGVLVPHFESVLLPSLVGGAVRGRGFEGVMPLSSPPTPVLASQSDRHFCLEYSARTQEPFPPACVTFRSRIHCLFFILFSSKGSDIPVSQFGSSVAILSQTWRAGDIGHWLKWSLRNVCGV